MEHVQRRIGPLTLDIPAALIGVQILLKGISKLEGLGHHPVIITSLLLLGSFVLVGAVLPHWLEKRIKHAHSIFHVAEGVAMALSAILLFEKGKLRIPILLIFVGLMYVVIGYLESRSAEDRARLGPQVMKGMAWAIISGGLVLVAFTLLRDRDPWALGAGGLCVIVGVAMMFAVPRLQRLNMSAGEAGAADAH